MKDKNEVIIYIGKSVNLKSRVRSYFTKNAELNFAKKRMIKLVVKVDYIETGSDLEALVLETNMIKQHQPKYNVLMKDDKNLTYIKISDGNIPIVSKTRIKTKSGTYFGPYTQYLNVTGTLHELKKIFCLGNHLVLKKGKQPPCMDTYIGICPGHCTGDPEKIDQYKKNLKDFTHFMRGDIGNIFEELETEMKQLAKDLKFEEAAKIKNKIDQLHQIHDKQIVRDAVDGDFDVIVMLEKYEKTFIGCLEVRKGQIVGAYHYTLKNAGHESLNEQLQNFVMQRYIDTSLSGSLLLGASYDLDLVEVFLREKGIKVHTPKRGDKSHLVEFANNDLLNFAMNEQMKHLTNRMLKKSDMISLLQTLFSSAKCEVRSSKKKPSNLELGTLNSTKKKKEIIFECYDISHHQGEHTVASKSVIVNGKVDTGRYKKYKIKTLRPGLIDDFHSMHEVLARRTRAHCEGKDMFPDLIIIDGGKGQLSKAVEAITSIFTAFENSKFKIQNSKGAQEQILNSEFGILNGVDLPVMICALAKREEEVFIPGRSDPIILEKGSSELMLLQKARDEAHRFAINFNRQKREKSYTKTVLEEIPGIGPKTRQTLLQKFGGIEGIGTASLDNLKKYLTKTQLQRLQEHGIVSSE